MYCACPLLSRDEPLKWVNQCRYLGIYFVSGHSFKCLLDQSKRQYFKAFNSIFSKFTITRSLMKLFRTGSANVVTD